MHYEIAIDDTTKKEIDITVPAAELDRFVDIEIDKINKPHRPIPAGILTKKQVLIISFSLSAIAGLLTIYLGITYFFIALVGLAIGVIYSVPQIYLKKNTFLSTMTIAVGYGILTFVTGWAVFKPIIEIPLRLHFFHRLHRLRPHEVLLGEVRIHV